MYIVNYAFTHPILPNNGEDEAQADVGDSEARNTPTSAPAPPVEAR